MLGVIEDSIKIQKSEMPSIANYCAGNEMADWKKSRRLLIFDASPPATGNYQDNFYRTVKPFVPFGD